MRGRVYNSLRDAFDAPNADSDGIRYFVAMSQPKNENFGKTREARELAFADALYHAQTFLLQAQKALENAK